jgi:hypothetical protein
MSRTRKTNPDFRHELSTDFVQALAADWKENGTTVIARVRQEAPEKYCELVAKIVPKEMLINSDRASDDFSDCQSQADIAIKLLKDIGVPDGAATPSMIEAAVEAQLLFVGRLEAIAKGN